jgi:hypothetical protein
MMLGVGIFETAFSHGFAGMLPKGVSILQADIPVDLLLRGFSRAYLVGAIICIVACLLSFAARDKKTTIRNRSNASSSLAPRSG